jgi:hypothetical protein
MKKKPNKKPRQAQSKKGAATTAVPISDKAYEIRLSASAEEAYERYFDLAEAARQRGDLTNSHITTMDMLDEVMTKVIPRDPFNRKYALQGDLSKIFRYWKGRLRICWIGSSEKRTVYIVFISETLRKAGDANDPYKILGRLVLAGQFDGIFEELGIQHPIRPTVQ